ncbi:MAG: hypothetical protein ACERKO_03640 [Acetanaerobacterium sp.]
MANALIEQCLGKRCLITTSSLSGAYQGTVVEITDNWIKLERKGTIDLINCDYIQNIRELPNKKGR